MMQILLSYVFYSAVGLRATRSGDFPKSSRVVDYEPKAD